MRISRDEARRFWAHPSQQIFGMTPDLLPDEPFIYFASGPFCGVAHPGPLRGVWIVDYAALPEGRGHLIQHARTVANECIEVTGATSLMGLTRTDLRLAISFITRVGFEKIGTITASNGEFVISKYRSWQWAQIQ